MWIKGWEKVRKTTVLHLFPHDSRVGLPLSNYHHFTPCFTSHTSSCHVCLLSLFLPPPIRFLNACFLHCRRVVGTALVPSSCSGDDGAIFFPFCSSFDCSLARSFLSSPSYLPLSHSLYLFPLSKWLFLEQLLGCSPTARWATSVGVPPIPIA